MGRERIWKRNRLEEEEEEEEEEDFIQNHGARFPRWRREVMGMRTHSRKGEG